ncbi:MAG: CHAT domain-containing protein [Candidatus Eremiobacteraeota bacterium]|nr:CHAT domain-containing protein [Candidatus Eremiobacteraeota bacterium]
MKKKLVYALMALSLCAPVAAQPQYPLPALEGSMLAQEDVGQFVLRCMTCSNEKQVIELVKADPKLARRSFAVTLKFLTNQKPAEREPASFGMLWLWARTLKDEKLKKQLVAAQIPDRPVTLVPIPYLGFGLAQVLVALGNFRQSEQVLQALEKTLPVSADKQRLILAKSRMVGGRYLLARQQGDALVELARKQPDPYDLIELYICLLDAGRMGGLPDVTNRYLEPFKQLVATRPESEQGVYNFFVGNFEELQRMERNPATTVEDFCKRHDAIWSGFQTAHPFAVPVIGRVFTHLTSLWLERMSDLYIARNIVPDSPEDELLSKSLNLELQIMQAAVARGAKQQGEIEPVQAALALMNVLNDAHQQALRAKQVKMGAGIVTEIFDVEKGLTTAEPKIRQAEKEATDQIMASAPSLPKSFSVSLVDGDWNRQRARNRLSQMQQMLVDPPPKLSQKQQQETVKGLAAQAIALNERSLRGAGYQGESDVRWPIIEYYLNSQPPGWQKEAERLIGQLFQVNSQLGYREGLAHATMLRGRLQAALGQDPAAMASLAQAVDSIEAYLTEMEAGESGAKVVRDRYKVAYDLLARLQVKNGKADGAFNTLSRKLEAEAAQVNQDSLRGNSQLRDVQRVKADTAALERQLAEERQQGSDTKASEQLLASSKGEFQRVVADLRRSHPQYEGAMAVRPVEFLELKKSIPADTTVVLYFVSEEGLYTFVASQKGDLKIRKVALNPKELEQSVTRVRQLINLFPSDPVLSQKPEAFSWTDPNSPGYQRQSLPLKTELARLNKWLIEPIQQDLEGRPVLAIVPTGLLHYVPFPALCSLDAAGNPKFLAESRQCVNLVKTSDLMTQTGGSGKKLFAVGNPDGSLPGAEREVTSIVASFPGGQKVIGKEATVARLKKLEPNTGYVHLATHGQLSEADPKNSYLVMAGSGESAQFRATDIYDLDWPGVRLVTLSACKTALQEGQPGAAITNLAEAFRVAGGHSVVASLWSVEDNATEKLMVEFYKQLAQGKSLGASLQKAELTLAGEPRYRHPFFWSAFTLFGDWR